MKKTLSVLLAVVLLALSFAACSGGMGSSAAADDMLAAIKEKGEITIAMEGTWAPWTYHDEDDKLVGYDVEVGQAIADKIGVEANFVEGEWDALLAGIESGRYDIMVNGVDIDENRKKTYDFSDPYAYNKTVIIVRADDDSIQSFEDLDGKTTANTVNSTYANVAEAYGANVTGVDDFNQTLELLTSGRIDATLNGEGSFYDYIKLYPDAPIKIAAISEDVTEVAIPVQKGEKNAELLKVINETISELRESGKLRELSEKYFGYDLSSKD